MSTAALAYRSLSHSCICVDGTVFCSVLDFSSLNGRFVLSVFFFFNDTATPEIYPLPLHAPLPIPRRCPGRRQAQPALRHAPPAPWPPRRPRGPRCPACRSRRESRASCPPRQTGVRGSPAGDRKSTRLNSSHDQISYAVFCLKKKKK